MLQPILLVEDSIDDAELIRQALVWAGIPNPILWAPTGEQAVALLERTESKQESLPSLILLDLTLAKLSGFGVLKILKEHYEWRTIPVLVITSSINPADIDRAMELGIEAYILKPMRFEQLVQLMKTKVGTRLKQPST